MNTQSTSVFGSFESYCKSSLNNTEYVKYCEPVRQQAEASAKWFQEAAYDAYGMGKDSWDKTGKHFGTAGQIVVILAVAGIAYNIFGGKKKQSENVDKRSFSVQNLDQRFYSDRFIESPQI